MPRKSIASSTLLLIASAGSWLSAAEGMRLISNGAVQAGTCGGGVAHAQDSSWISLNPAALVELTERADTGSDILRPTSTLTPKDGGLGLANEAAGEQVDRRWITTVSAGYATPAAGGVLAIGLYSVSGLALDYPQSRTTLGAGTGYDRRDDAAVATLATAFAKELVSGLSFGAALNLDYAQLRSDSLTTGLGETEGGFDRDRALGAGFLVGVQYRAGDVRFGASYLSRQWMQTFDQYRDLLPGSFDQPPVVQVGASWRIGMIEPLFDWRYINWTSIRTFREGFYWDNQQIFKGGVTAYVDPAWTLRAGVSWGRSPIDESSVLVNGLSPLISELHASLGGSWAATANHQLHAAYVRTFPKTMVDNGERLGGAGRGTEISLAMHQVTVGYSYLF